MRISCCVAALMLVGCPGGDPAGSEDGGTSTTTATGTTGSTGSETAATPTTTDGPPADAVIAPVIVTYLPLGGDPVEQPFDPLTKFMKITIVAGEGPQALAFPAVYDGSTRLEFVGVPEVSYRLRQQYGSYPTLPDEPGILYAIETDARELGIYTDTYSGRPDVGHSDSTATKVAISATGMQPLALADEFELYSYNADAILYFAPSFDGLDGTNTPLEGVTSLADWTVPWRPSHGRITWPLVDPEQGDDLWLAHLQGRLLVEQPDAEQAQDPWSFAQVSTLREVAAMSLAPMVGGETTALTGNFAPVPGETVTVDLRVEQFRAEIEAQGGPITASSCYTAVFLEPGVEHPIVGMVPSLGSVYAYSQPLDVDPMCPADSCDPNVCDSCEQEYKFIGDRVFDLEYANPYPGGTELISITCTVTTFVTNPVDLTDERLAASLSVTRRLSDVADGPFVPTLGLVGDLRVNGDSVSFEAVQVGVGTTPTISFAPPTYGSPDKYTITVRDIADVTNIDGDVISRVTTGSMSTVDTTVTLPEGMLKPGSYYFLQVTAQHGSDLTGAGFYTHDMASSTAITGILTP